jgi:hypothetical protein
MVMGRSSIVSTTHHSSRPLHDREKEKKKDKVIFPVRKGQGIRFCCAVVGSDWARLKSSSLDCGLDSQPRVSPAAYAVQVWFNMGYANVRRLIDALVCVSPAR